jgi:DNA-binding phage protein
MTKISKFDAADYLKTPAAIAAYLTEAFETNDPAYIRMKFETGARRRQEGRRGRSRSMTCEKPAD